MDTFVVETRVRIEGSGRDRLQAAPARLERHEAVLADPPVVIHAETADGFALVQFSIAADNEVKAQRTGLEVATEALEVSDDDEQVTELQVSARRLEPKPQ